jgi:mannose-6-phosphate isomerase-like protein (cupin superfamily)
MEIKKYADAESFPFGHLVIRDLTPGLFSRATLSEIEVPIGADTPPYAAHANDKVYVGVTGDIAFDIDGKTVRVRRGDVLVVHRGESFRYHNGGYEMGRLFLIQIPPAADDGDVS